MSTPPKTYNEKWFWSIIRLVERDRSELADILSNLEKHEIEAFQDHFVDFACELREELYLELMQRSKDGGEDIANWVVSGGYDYYQEVRTDPGKIPDTVEGMNEGNLYGVADEVYYDKFDEEMDIY